LESLRTDLTEQRLDDLKHYLIAMRQGIRTGLRAPRIHEDFLTGHPDFESWVKQISPAVVGERRKRRPSVTDFFRFLNPFRAVRGVFQFSVTGVGFPLFSRNLSAHA